MATDKKESPSTDVSADVYETKIGRVRRSDLVTRKVGFDLGLYDPVTQDVHILNATAATIWDHITPNRTYLNVADALAMSYGYSPELAGKIGADVVELVKRFETAGLTVDPEQAASRDKTAKQQPDIFFPDKDVTKMTADYLRPVFHTFTVEALKERFKLDESPVRAPFHDCWH